MKIKIGQLRRIIKEEVSRVFEATPGALRVAPEDNSGALRLAPEDDPRSGALRVAPEEKGGALRAEPENKGSLKSDSGEKQDSSKDGDSNKKSYNYWHNLEMRGSSQAPALMDAAIKAGAVKPEYVEKWNSYKEAYAGKKLSPDDQKKKMSAAKEIFKITGQKAEFKKDVFVK